MLTYLVQVKLSGGIPFLFLAREEDVGRPNKNKKWADSITSKLRRYQLQKGERNHHLTRISVVGNYRHSEYGPNLPLLGGTQCQSPTKIYELSSPQLCLPIFA